MVPEQIDNYFLKIFYIFKGVKMLRSHNSMNLSFKKAKELVNKSEDIKIYTHIDCDGVTAGAILSSMLDRLEKDHEIEFISLDKIEDLKSENELTIFSDLGSGQDMNKFCTSSSKTLILRSSSTTKENKSIP